MAQGAYAKWSYHPGMAITPDENEKYRQFVNGIAHDLGVYDYEPQQEVWHYTNDSGLLGILQSTTLYATQVALLNNERETRYATELFRTGVQDAIGENESAGDSEAAAFFQQILRLIEEDPKSPVQGVSKFFIASFSGQEDNVSQWNRYSRPHGYAVGFLARGLNREPNSTFYKVVYDIKKTKGSPKRNYQRYATVLS